MEQAQLQSGGTLEAIDTYEYKYQHFGEKVSLIIYLFMCAFLLERPFLSSRLKLKEDLNPECFVVRLFSTISMTNGGAKLSSA